MDYENLDKNKKDLKLTDHLAIDRTKLAYERTFLAYMRTVVSFIVAALTLFKLLKGIEGTIAALILIISAIYCLYRARKIYKEVNRTIK